MKLSKAFWNAHCAALAMALAFALALPTAAQAYQCASTVVHAEAHANTRIQARTGARTIWSNAAKDKYGFEWGVWNIAQSKSLTCNWTGNQFWCIAEAKPCKYVVQ